jgi:hypothetical protein
MSDLLTRLAQRALGTAAPAVQPRLPSRYADPGAAERGPSLLREESVETEASPFAGASPAVPAPRRRPAAPPADPHPTATHPAARRDPRPDDPSSIDPSRVQSVDPRPRAAEANHPPTPVRGSFPTEEVVERVVDADRPNPSAESRAAASLLTASGEARSGEEMPRRPSSSIPSAPSGEQGGEDGFHLIEQLVDAEDEGLLMPRVASSRRGRRVRGAADGESAPSTRPREDGSPAARPLRARRTEAASGEPLEVVKVVGAGDRDSTEAAEGEASAGEDARASAKAGAARAEAARVAGRTARQTAEERPNERPVVRVTIGRIEVRAAEPPPAPRPAARPGWTPPVLSLDQYLKRESGR